MVARLNNGRLGTVAAPRLIEGGRDVHADTDAALMKEVAIREFRGGSSGGSFRIAKGVRYNVGAIRGKSVAGARCSTHRRMGRPDPNRLAPSEEAVSLDDPLVA